MWLGRQVGSGDLFEPSDKSNETILLFPPLLALLAAILDLSVTITSILPWRRATSLCVRSIKVSHKITSGFVK